jgi:hypothetical protein
MLAAGRTVYAAAAALERLREVQSDRIWILPLSERRGSESAGSRRDQTGVVPRSRGVGDVDEDHGISARHSAISRPIFLRAS